ncbi:MAG TPA: sensor histidine kinase, partial [Afifellaceae bacterium]|nr:sensor histidine kinase [Afifellaceae bacterium]
MDFEIEKLTGEERAGFGGPRLRLSTLNKLRWLAIGGQTTSILIVGLWLEFPLPYLPCFLLIGL